VEIPRFWAWIATDSLTEFTTNFFVPINVQNEGTPKKKNLKIIPEF
jgi:hypothetical protein